MKLLKLYYVKKCKLKNCFTIILTIIVFFFSAGSSWAQIVDSLKKQLGHVVGTQTCVVFYQIGYELVDVDFIEALRYSEKSIQCAIQHGDTLQMVKGIQLKAIAFRRLGEIDSSNNIIASVLPMVRRKMYYAELQDLLHGLAIGLLHKAQFDEALKHNFEALEIRRKHGSKSQIGSTLSNIGLVYYRLSDYDKALEYDLQALDIFHSTDIDRDYVANLVLNIALCHAFLGRFDESRRYIKDVVNGCEPDCSPQVIQHTSFCEGIIAFRQSHYADARRNFQMSYAISTELQDDRLALDNIVYLSRLYLSSGELSQSEHYLDLAEGLIRKGVPYSMEQMMIYSELSSLFEKKGNYKKVAEYQRRQMALKDSIYDDQVTTRLMRIVAKHIEEEKNANIAAQNEKLELNAAIISRQRIVAILAFTTVILFAGFIILLVQNIREKKRRNIDLEVRVKNRTKDLETIVNQSQRLYTEKKMWFDKIQMSVRNTGSTVIGLSSLASMDAESNKRCIELIAQEMQQLITNVNNYVSRSNDGINEVNDEG
ncbi:MAG: tetratricopeptide repeat protein [Chryseolinea sp.]